MSFADFLQSTLQFFATGGRARDMVAPQDASHRDTQEHQSHCQSVTRLLMRLFHRFILIVFLLPSAAALLISCGSGGEDGAASQGGAGFAAAGGFIEPVPGQLRPRWSAAELRTFLPTTRGKFLFPPPYNTEAIRITDASDCGGTDCVTPVGYSYWRNSNAHEGSNDMWIFLSLNHNKGGSGPTLFKLDKSTDTITKVGPLFPAVSQFAGRSGDGWYFSASKTNKLYINDGPKLLRYDVVTHEFDTVFDVTGHFGSGRLVWQAHSSNDDLVHSATLRVTGTNEDLGCMVFQEATGQFSFYPKRGSYDECHIDKSGRYLMILENTDGRNGLENVIIDLQTGAENVIYDENGGVGHADMGYDYVVGADGYNALPNAFITWSFLPSLIKGPTVFHSSNWNISRIDHVSHQNAKPSLPMQQQFACGSTADRGAAQNEILCFRLDGSQQDLVVAPVMTDLNASGGGTDYFKLPKGNLDISGQYFIWTTNMGGNRIDAFLVKVPAQLLFN
jgi:hypothetical protein